MAWNPSIWVNLHFSGKKWISPVKKKHGFQTLVNHWTLATLMGPPFKIENMWTIQVRSCASCGELPSSTQAWQWNKIDWFIDDFATQTFIFMEFPLPCLITGEWAMSMLSKFLSILDLVWTAKQVYVNNDGRTLLHDVFAGALPIHSIWLVQ